MYRMFIDIWLTSMVDMLYSVFIYIYIFFIYTYLNMDPMDFVFFLQRKHLP